MTETPRQSESRRAATILGRILVANPPVVGVSASRRRWALELAISLLEARAHDAEED
jgi:hypothetical protein